METYSSNNRHNIDSEQAVVPMDIQESTSEIDNISINRDANMQIAPSSDSTTTVSMNATTIDPLTDEQLRAEATFSFKVEEVSKLKEKILSPAYYVRNLPWKIIVMPHKHKSQLFLGFFLQCNGESDSLTWACQATAELRMKSYKEGQEAFTRRFKHLFYSKKNDWGYSFFMSWKKTLDPENGYIKDDCIILEVHVQAEVPHVQVEIPRVQAEASHGDYWDSKKHTGYVGLTNQGATCYMNSLLQTLYFTNQLRKAVYKMPTHEDDSSKSVALALQCVFYDLQFTDKPVETEKLTKSFGWGTLDSFKQHDLQEFLRVLLDKLESKMKGTCVEGTVPKLFEGNMQSYIQCKNVDFKSSRLETFYDIQLNIKGKGTIYESFDGYIAPEILEGDNKYDAGEHGFQEAEKGVNFLSFPPVLHLHLLRFQYDPDTGNSVKFNDRFEFYEEIHLDKYLDEKEAKSINYILHTVIVHSGDNHGGHYVAYINPSGDRDKWYKFNDDNVSRVTKSEAIEQNYGVTGEKGNLNSNQSGNAYMLVYIRESALKDILPEITSDDTPNELKDRLIEKKHMIEIDLEKNSYITIHVLLEECFECHQTTDLFDTDKTYFRAFHMNGAQPVSHLIKVLAETFKVVDTKRMRIWILPDNLLRPKYFDFNKSIDEQINNIQEFQNSAIIFLELAPADIDGPLPPFDKNTDILIIFKFYDPQEKRLNYAGYKQYSLEKKVSELIPDLNACLDFPAETDLTIYEENAQSVFKINSITEILEKSLKYSSRDDVHGTILIFEKKHIDEKLEFPTCNDFIQDMPHKITFVDKCNLYDTGFILELSQRSRYEKFANAVGEKIQSNPYQIQFFQCHIPGDMPGKAIPSSFDGQLKELIRCSTKPKLLFYQRLSMNLSEFENKKLFKCQWVPSNLSEEKSLDLYPNKNGTVANLLEEAAKQIEFTENSTQKLRILETSRYKLLPGPSEDTPLARLQGVMSVFFPKVYRIEEVPRDELVLNENEMLITVSHFTKEVHNTFGIPFYIKLIQGESFRSLKKRIQKKLNVPNKEWEEYKMAVISMGGAEYITNDLASVNLEHFKLDDLKGWCFNAFGLYSALSHAIFMRNSALQ